MISPAKFLRVTLAAAAISSLCVVGASAASLGVGTVTADALRLRDSASTSGTILATAPKGETVIVLENAGNNWYKVDYDSVQGYMSGDYLSIATQANVSIGYGQVKTGGSTLNVRSGPGTGYGRVTSLADGTVVQITGINNGWYKITYNGTSGYVSSDYMISVKSATAASRGSATTTAATSSMGQQVVAYAKQFLGTPYVYGGNGPSSFDCSGFTKYVYAHFGYTLNRTATDQLANGTAVSKSQLQPGDLVFFNNGYTSKPVSHVGIYIGNGQFIHASTNQYEVQIDNLNSGYYSRTYVYGRHIL